jgi:hypothetical protein
MGKICGLIWIRRIVKIAACSTLIDSTPGVLAAWAIFAKDYEFDGVEAAHGATKIDSRKRS